MLRSLIFFSALAAHCASVSGSVQITSHSHRPPTDIVIWLHPLSPTESEAHALPHKVLLQKDKTFQPHVLPVRAGTVVDFPNADPIFHNAFSNYDGQIFDVSLYPPGTTRSIQFRKPGIVRVFCNIHPMMSAVILVLDTPYFASVSRNGTYRIDGVAPGDYQLMVFDERATSGESTRPTISVGDADLQLNVLRLSEAGYVPVRHLNKYGQDYPAAADSYSDIPK